ncbi:MAG: epoxyqueuosine reductase QueH [Deltaproteobacteria bacterium]|nr:epoxyqueuosine reductase QueH [Deltaproteobacteria bacterium]
MNLLLHICCAPCTIYPLKVLRGEGMRITGFFYNPNIHPYLEFKRRLDTLKEYSRQADLAVICDETYYLREFLRAVVGHEDERCGLCYTLRLREAARVARKEKCDAFTTTLLYSKYQKHQIIREVGELIGQQENIPFVYLDFREGWQEGITMSRKMGMYRQGYCGCLYSEKDRYQSVGAAKVPC